jgi:hypothetical protein
MSDVLFVENNGPDLIKTNFWTNLDRGKFLVSINARAFRILIPKSEESELEEMKTGREVVISRGPWPEERLDEAVELMFEDGSSAPYALHLDAKAFEVLPAKQDEGRTDLQAIVYVCGDQGQPKEALRLPAKYRRAPKLPWMKHWKAKR